MTQPPRTLHDMGWSEGPLIGFDLETTGIDPGTDLPVQVALIRWDPPDRPHRKVFIVDPGCEVPPGVQAIHGISTQRARREGCPLAEAAAIVHSVLNRAQLEQVPVVAMNASFDVTIATVLFRTFGLEPINWEALVDPLVIDRQIDRYRSGKRRLGALCDTYDVMLATPHDAGNDADAAVSIVRTIAVRYPEIAAYKIGDLTRFQIEWHRTWAFEYDSWCKQNGRPGLAPEDFYWPLREVLDPHMAA